jgi:DNA-binding XRE family transcriptional regulator
MSFFAKNIKKIRIAKRMNQSEFAALFGLKRTALGSYEEGRAEPKLDVIIQIADYFNLSLDILVRQEITVNDIFHFKSDMHLRSEILESQNRDKPKSE